MDRYFSGSLVEAEIRARAEDFRQALEGMNTGNGALDEDDEVAGARHMLESVPEGQCQPGGARIQRALDFGATFEERDNLQVGDSMFVGGNVTFGYIPNKLQGATLLRFPDQVRKKILHSGCDERFAFLYSRLNGLLCGCGSLR